MSCDCCDLHHIQSFLKEPAGSFMSEIIGGLLGELVFDGLVSLYALKRLDYSSIGIVIPKHQKIVKLNILGIICFIRGLIHYGRFIRKNLKR